MTVVTSNEGWSFNLNGPLLACRHCGGNRWEMFVCGPVEQVSLRTQA